MNYNLILHYTLIEIKPIMYLKVHLILQKIFLNYNMRKPSLKLFFSKTQQI